MSYPMDVHADHLNNIWIADYGNRRVRLIISESGIEEDPNRVFYCRNGATCDITIEGVGLLPMDGLAIVQYNDAKRCGGKSVQDAIPFEIGPENTPAAKYELQVKYDEMVFYFGRLALKKSGREGLLQRSNLDRECRLLHTQPIGGTSETARLGNRLKIANLFERDLFLSGHVGELFPCLTDRTRSHLQKVEVTVKAQHCSHLPNHPHGVLAPDQHMIDENYHMFL